MFNKYLYSFYYVPVNEKQNLFSNDEQVFLMREADKKQMSVASGFC